jgi:hypothetical protein
MFLVGFSKPGRLRETNCSSKNGGFVGWAGNPPKENKILIIKDAQPWISADQMIIIIVLFLMIHYYLFPSEHNIFRCL